MMRPIASGMTRSAKTSYSLDPDTERGLVRLARRWGVSESEALRRAIMASARVPADDTDARIAAFDRAQEIMHLDAATVDAWVRDIRAERRAWKPER